MIKVRFAPSPTGKLHVGGARTALFNYLFARHTNGKFILRIEDTNIALSKEEYLKDITDSLQWLGIDWDGEPVFQSQRLEIYRNYAEQLLKKNLAYEEETEKGKAIVFKISRETIKWKDLIHGEIGRNLLNDPDLVIMKSDGTPTYNFACVIDDMESGITHVIRGDDHIANTSKQICLYRKLQAPIPEFAHIPLILNPDGSKMSKDYTKRGKEAPEIIIPTSVNDYKDTGYLPEAMFNFLALLGWSPGDNREILSKQELISIFDIKRIRHIPAKFDIDKLRWINAHYIRQKSVDEIKTLLLPRLKGAYNIDRFPAEVIDEAILQQKDRLVVLSDIVPLTKFVFEDEITIDPQARQIIENPGAKEALKVVEERLSALEIFEKQTIEEVLRKIASEMGVKFQDVAQPVRVAITGSTASPPIHETIYIVGQKTALRRLRKVLNEYGL